MNMATFVGVFPIDTGEKTPSSANCQWPSLADVSAAGPVGVLDALYLLIRIDLSDWWSKIKIILGQIGHFYFYFYFFNIYVLVRSG